MTEHTTEAQQIEAFFQTKALDIQQRYFGEKDAIKKDVKLTDAERVERGYAVNERLSREREAALKNRNASLEKREQDLRRRLFGAPVGHKDGVAVQSAAFTDALTRATLASEEDLGRLAEVAARTGDKALGKAVFVAAEQRGMADLAVPYLNSNPDVLADYRELGTMPTAEDRQRDAENAAIPKPKIGELRPSFEHIQSAAEGERMDRINAQDAYLNNTGA